MSWIIIHLLTHEIPLLILVLLSFIFGKKAVFKYVRKHDPAVRELLEAANLSRNTVILGGYSKSKFAGGEEWVAVPAQDFQALRDALDAVIELDGKKLYGKD